MRRIRNKILVLLLTLILFSFFSFQGCTTQKPSDIKIGIILPLSGPSSDFGEGGLNGFNLALDEINRSGGVLNRSIELLIRDDKNDPTTAANSALELIYEEKVVSITGVPFSSIALAVAPVCQNAKIPMLSAVSTNNQLTKTGNYIFRACFNNDFEGYAAAFFSINELKAVSCGVIYDSSNPFASNLAEMFREHFKELGGKISLYYSHPAGMKDFRKTLKEIIDKTPDIIFCPDMYEDAANICIQARELGFDKPIIGGDGWDSEELVKIGKDAVNNTYYVSHFAKDDPNSKIQAFMKGYRDKFGKEPNVESILCYDSLMMLAKAIEKAGSAEPNAIRDALSTLEFDGVTGIIKFENGGDPVKPATIIKVIKGVQSFETRIYPP